MAKHVKPLSRNRTRNGYTLQHFQQEIMQQPTEKQEV